MLPLTINCLWLVTVRTACQEARTSGQSAHAFGWPSEVYLRGKQVNGGALEQALSAEHALVFGQRVRAHGIFLQYRTGDAGM